MLTYFLPTQHFRRNVRQTPTECIRVVPLVKLFAEAEISQFYEPIITEQDVLGFEVSVYDILLMEVLNGEKELSYDANCLFFFNSLFLGD